MKLFWVQKALAVQLLVCTFLPSYILQQLNKMGQLNFNQNQIAMNSSFLSFSQRDPQTTTEYDDRGSKKFLSKEAFFLSLT